MSTVEYNASEAFDYSTCIRNVALDKMGLKAPRMTSTGTTIVACITKDAVVMGADSRATQGNLISDKNCQKVHRLTDSIYSCGAGTAADIHQVAAMISANLRLKELNAGRKARVVQAVKMARQHLFQYQGYVGAYMLIGGVDTTGPHLYDVSAHGSSMHLPFCADGSGSYCAIAVLERDFRFGMSVDEGKALVQRALEAGMHGDNMSGNSLNLSIITKDKTVFEGPIVPAFCVRPEAAELTYKFKPGTTTVLKEKKFKYDIIEQMDVQ